MKNSCQTNTPNVSCLKNIFWKILKSLILNPEITVFFTDIGYLLKLLSNH